MLICGNEKVVALILRSIEEFAVMEIGPSALESSVSTE